MHYVQAKSILSAKNGMNLYRGCEHGCIYCDSRSTCYSMEHRFEDIEVKENSLFLLEQNLKRKRKRCMIGTGSMSDPYMPLENELCYTRRALELIEKYGFGLSILTKSDLILRDKALLCAINEKSRCVVQITVTTHDDKLCRLIEPGVCTGSRRFDVLSRLSEAGIETALWLCPILPFINDTAENISAIVESSAEAGVRAIVCFGMGLTLRQGSREYFYAALDRLFPGMKERYIKSYGDSYVLNSPRQNELMSLFVEKCEKAGIMHDNKKIFQWLNHFEEKSEQLSFFD